MITFDITSGGTLGCGYKYDQGLNTIQFEGFEKQSEADTVYLVFDNGTEQSVELTADLTVEVGSPITDAYGEMEAQLVEISPDGSFVKNSNIFYMLVKRSVGRELPTSTTEEGEDNG